MHRGDGPSTALLQHSFEASAWLSNTAIGKTAGLSQEENDAYFERTALDTPLGRNGLADDIAAAALYLASDESAFVTEIELLVDGGYAQI
jgi:NAD(P)-dependent dehydrogenase (short-subunit alcohol dehydrogenase family)